MKRILITGKNSYIGTSFENYIKDYYSGEYSVDTLDVVGDDWKNTDFSGYDSIFHVAGIVHRKKNCVDSSLYYKVNRDLTYNIAKKALDSGVGQIVFLSTMSVYGKMTGEIKRETPLCPANDYGKSKYEAEELLGTLVPLGLKVCILRPPMVYGKGCKGNYNTLSGFVGKFPIFPDFTNKRSMIYVGNLCEFVKNAVELELEGIYFPQNKEPVCTSDMVRKIAKARGEKVVFTKIFNPFLKLFKKMGVGIVSKCFGDLYYVTSEPLEYVDKFSFDGTIELTEKLIISRSVK